VIGAVEIQLNLRAWAENQVENDTKWTILTMKTNWERKERAPPRSTELCILIGGVRLRKIRGTSWNEGASAWDQQTQREQKFTNILRDTEKTALIKDLGKLKRNFKIRSQSLKLNGTWERALTHTRINHRRGRSVAKIQVPRTFRWATLVLLIRQRSIGTKAERIKTNQVLF